MRALGLFLLALIPALTGFFRGERLRREERTLEAVLSFLRHIRFQIEVFSREQEKIFTSFENPLLEKSGFLPRLRELTEKDPCGALKYALAESLSEWKMGINEEKGLLDFAESFGSISRERQLEECDRAISLISEAVGARKKDLPAQIKLARMIGAAAGLGMLILLL